MVWDVIKWVGPLVCEAFFVHAMTTSFNSINLIFKEPELSIMAEESKCYNTQPLLWRRGQQIQAVDN